MATKRDKMGLHIVEVEGRFDRLGRLQVYELPPADGGGRFEVAGINEKYHKAKATRLRNMIQAGRHAEAKKQAADYIMEYTEPVVAWFAEGKVKKYPHIELLLRDTFFNRGNRGAAAVLQLALNESYYKLHVDGRIGPMSRRAFTEVLANEPDALARRITDARATYERHTYPWKPKKRDTRSQFWRGLQNRWAKTHDVAMSLVA